jgi:carbon monoxide dehydrogenase subunit G
LIKNIDATKCVGGIKIKAVIFAVIFLSIAVAFVTLPQAFATSFNVSRAISAPANVVWDIISNVDNETQYWSTFKAIKNINKTDNIVEREVAISAGPQNSTSHQFVTLYPEQMKIQTNLKGVITGSRILELEPIYDNKSRVHVIWNIDLSGIPIASRGIAEDSIKQTTKEAVLRIAEAAE